MAKVKDLYASARRCANVLINHRLTLDTQSHDLSEAEVNNEFEYIVDRMFKGMQRGKEFDGFLEAVLDVLKEEQAENNYLMLK